MMEHWNADVLRCIPPSLQSSIISLIELALPRGLAPRASAFARQCASLLHLGSKVDVRPGLAPGNVDLRTTGSASSPCARLKWVPSAGSAPAPSRSQREMLLLHHEGNVEMGPPVGLLAPPHGLAP